MKTKLIPLMALSLMGIFATASFAQEESAPAADAAITQEVSTGNSDNTSEKVAKEDPRADRAKERFERKDAKKAEIAEHKAEKKALKEERAQARDASKAEKKAMKEESKEAKKAEKDARKAEKKALKEERKEHKSNHGRGHNK